LKDISKEIEEDSEEEREPLTEEEMNKIIEAVSEYDIENKT
jgi:hypothetical protein